MLFKIVIVGEGAEPCSTTTAVGEALKAECGRPDCPGCLARAIAAEFKSRGLLGGKDGRFLITYDPGAPDAVVEDLANGVLEKRGALETDARAARAEVAVVEEP